MIFNVKRSCSATIILAFLLCLNSCHRNNVGESSCEVYLNSCKELNEPPFTNFCDKTFAYFDFETARNEAESQKKDLLIYFNSIACVRCRSFEEEIFFDSTIAKQLKDNYIIVVLFTDIRCPLPNSNVISEISGKTLKTVGAYNSELQVVLTQSGFQPYVSIIKTNKELISTYTGELNSTEDFQNWILSKSNF